MAELEASLRRAVEGRASLLFVHGHSGVGKSSLIEEVRQPVNQLRGYVAMGKTDQLYPGPANALVVQALGDLATQLLTEDDDTIAALRRKLRSVLGTDTSVLTEAVPEFARTAQGPHSATRCEGTTRTVRIQQDRLAVPLCTGDTRPSARVGTRRHAVERCGGNRPHRASRDGQPHHLPSRRCQLSRRRDRGRTSCTRPAGTTDGGGRRIRRCRVGPAERRRRRQARVGCGRQDRRRRRTSHRPVPPQHRRQPSPHSPLPGFAV